jgi:hypothetical protein
MALANCVVLPGAKEFRPGIIDEWDLVERYQADIIRLVSVSGPRRYSLLPVHFALKDNNLTLILASITLFSIVVTG